MIEFAIVLLLNRYYKRKEQEDKGKDEKRQWNLMYKNNNACCCKQIKKLGLIKGIVRNTPMLSERKKPHYNGIRPSSNTIDIIAAITFAISFTLFNIVYWIQRYV